MEIRQLVSSVLHENPFCLTLWLLLDEQLLSCRGRQLSRRSFDEAQETFLYALLKRMQPYETHVFWAIGFRCVQCHHCLWSSFRLKIVSRMVMQSVHRALTFSLFVTFSYTQTSLSLSCLLYLELLYPLFADQFSQLYRFENKHLPNGRQILGNGIVFNE